ncbi:hypothetical protein D6833_13450 [Candidatus Parcubacteria bacterium]|nr:MAG: hypothetical protein D6833_13450 [Candidatus Parcubacteria bacterium]
MFQRIRGDWRFRQEELRRQREQEPHVPLVGEVAPDFTLTDITGEHTVTLSQFRGQKPVALAFGSFT